MSVRPHPPTGDITSGCKILTLRRSEKVSLGRSSSLQYRHLVNIQRETFEGLDPPLKRPLNSGRPRRTDGGPPGWARKVTRPGPSA